MRKLTKTTLVIVMALISFVTLAMGLTASVSKTFANAEIKAVLGEVNFELSSDVQIFIDLTEKGYSKDNFGLSFTAKADKDGYDAVKNDSDLKVKFGMAILPFDIVGEQVVSNDNLLFEDDGVYFKSAFGGQKKVNAIEKSSLTAYQKGDVNYYYMNLTIDSSSIEEKDDQFVVVPYIKGTTDSTTVYVVGAYDESVVYSPAYAGQLCLEKGVFVDDDMRRAVKDAYTMGVTDSIAVNYTISYDGDGVKNNSKSLTFPIGTVVTENVLREKFDNSNLVNEDFYAFDSGLITVGGVEKDAFTVYANGKSNAVVDFDFTAKEADVDVYQAFKGYYIADNAVSLLAKADKSLVLNADNAIKMDTTVVDYVLYADGTVKILYGDDVLFGTYDLDSNTLSLTDGDVTVKYSRSVEVANGVYKNVSGVYSDGVSTFVLNADGTLTKNLVQAGSYLLTFDLENEKFDIHATILSDNSYSSELVCDNGLFSFEFDNGVIQKDKNVSLASANDYKAIANDYKGSFYLPLTNTTVANVLPFDAMISLYDDGTLTYKGVDSYSPNAAFNNAWTSYGLLQDVKNGRYVLFADGTMKLYIPQIAKRLSASDYGVVDVVLDATFSESDGTITLDLSDYKAYRTTEVYTAVSKTNNSQSEIERFAGAYTGTYVFGKDGFVTRRDLNTFATDPRALYTSDEPFTVKAGSTVVAENITSIYYTRNGYNPIETGSYTLNNGVIEIKFESETLVGTYFDDEFTIDGVTNYKVDIDTLYADLTKTTYKDANGYNGTKLQFTTNEATWFGGYAGQGGAQNWSFDYKIIPITANFGKIEAVMTDKSQSSDGNNFYDFGRSVAEIYYVYDAINGTFNLSVSSGVASSRGLVPTFNHFTDYNTDGVKVSDTLYSTLAKTFTDGTNTLVLNGLATDLVAYKADGTTTGSAFKGGKAKLNGNDISYSLIGTTANSGKIFLDLSDKPQHYNVREDKTTFVSGDYYIYNGKYVVSFNADGKTYLLADGGSDNLIKNALSGTYVGTGAEFTLFANGSAKFNGLDATYTVNPKSMSNGMVEITVDGQTLIGAFNESSGTYKVAFDNDVYIKKFMSNAELYAKYAGTYNATYIVSNGATNTMKLVLNADGTFVGTGTSSVADENRNCHGNNIIVMNKHLGSTERHGTYSFEVIDGAINIVLKFDIYNGDMKLVYSGSEKTYKVNHLSGYYAGIKYASYWGSSNANYGVPTGDGTAVYNVYTYACGTVGEGVLSVNFEAFSDAPITLTKAN